MTSKKIKIIVGGVHEFTNFPFLYALTRGWFLKAGIDLTWIIYPSGSAPLAIALDTDAIQFAVILTDSAIGSISKGMPITLVSPYVLSPLNWVFHVNSNSKIKKPEEMIGKRFAISKYGSGGELAAKIWAYQNGYQKLSDKDFVVVNNMEGAELALKNNLADVFPWEYLTALPLVESGILKPICNFETPYTPFSIACSKKMAVENPELVKKVLEITYKSASKIKSLSNASKIISATYNRNLLEVEKSFNKNIWANNSNFEEGMIEKTVEMLSMSDAIKNIHLKENDIVTLLS